VLSSEEAHTKTLRPREGFTAKHVNMCISLEHAIWLYFLLFNRYHCVSKSLQNIPQVSIFDIGRFYIDQIINNLDKLPSWCEKARKLVWRVELSISSITL
jgi:hypothetical protein